MNKKGSTLRVYLNAQKAGQKKESENKNMRKIVKLEGLCCANCAAKIEEGVKKLPGVKEAALSFMTQRLTLEVADGMEDVVLEQARVLADKIEPEAEFKILR